MVENKKISKATALSLSEGYTLIELIVVMGIAAVIFAVTVASFDSFNSGKRIDAESENLKSKIEEIFKKTITGDLEGNVGCLVDGSTVFNQCDSSNYTLSVTANNYSLSFYCDCPGVEAPITKILYTVSDIPAAAKITFSPVASFVFEKDKTTSGCINVINKGTNYNAVIFNYPGNVSIGTGASCP